MVVAFFLALSTFAKKKEYPRAEIKVSYIYHETFVRGSDGIIKRDLPFVLLVNKEQSKFYSPATERKDSLESTPKGRAVIDQLFRDTMERYTATKDMSP